MRDKLFNIIDNIQKDCAHEGTYCCDCNYNGYDSLSCWKYKMVDAIIESGLVVDDKVYSPKTKKNYIDKEHDVYNWEINCSKCGYDLTREPSNYCPNCGVKLKE